MEDEDGEGKAPTTVSTFGSFHLWVGLAHGSAVSGWGVGLIGGSESVWAHTGCAMDADGCMQRSLKREFRASLGGRDAAAWEAWLRQRKAKGRERFQRRLDEVPLALFSSSFLFSSKEY